jgi:site-specific recombinase XerD
VPKTYPPETLTAAEVEALLDLGGAGPLATRNRALIALLWRSGLRISEALSLKPSDVRAGQIHVRKGKGSKSRVVCYDRVAAGYFDAWIAHRTQLGINGHSPLFCSVSNGPKRKAGEPIDSSYVRHLLPKLARDAGITKRLHSHAFRHTLASELASEKLRLPAISSQLGHASTATTDRYLRKITAGDLAEDLAAIGRTI